MKPLAQAPSRHLLATEIASLHRLMTHPRSGLELYSFRSSEAPTLMYEVGRLREEAFRAAGGGTGQALDIDKDDIAADGYRQLIAWDAVGQRVVGAYRYIIGSECDIRHISSAHYFDFNPHFRQHYLPQAIELGRSFVVHSNSHNTPPRSLFAMEALWQGLGKIVHQTAGIDYLFGKVTIYPNFGEQATAVLHHFLKSYFSPKEPLLIRAKKPLPPSPSIKNIFCGKSFRTDYRLLVEQLRVLRRRIPPMINAYMKLSPALEIYDTTINPDFGNVRETAILLPIQNIVKPKREQYIKK